jgi:hypothetical protein
MDFFEKLKQMLMGSPSPAPSPEPTGKPWERPLSPEMTPGFHRMPGGPLMPDAAMQPPPEAPAAPQGQEAIGRQIEQLLKQREVAKKFIPEGTWNR